VLTERLDLRPIDPDDLAELFTITSDPRTWEHEPTNRHRVPETTKHWIERAAARWQSDGLSYWMIRLRDTPAAGQGEALRHGQVIGVGGVQRRADRSWNIFYRLSPRAWGHGYATELGRAAIDAAHRADPDQPVAAWILDHNHPSRRVAERLGLQDEGLRVDANDGIVRRVYADRPLPPADSAEESFVTPSP
jgi:RimJ/RimL family protein N-acetyltransferase